MEFQLKTENSNYKSINAGGANHTSEEGSSHHYLVH